MRYQKLIIKNLLSIESAEINFEQSPLAGEPLFLITGDTGAGKSTILDAISLSLYGMAPRMSRTTATEKYYSQVDDEIAVNHVSQMMRRHTAESETQLYFEGNDGKEYIASWKIWRSRGKVDGSLQRAINTITEIQSGITVTKQGDLSEILERAVGMNYEQFCRTSMLAQGEFTRFLHSAPGDKAAILEKLTGTEIYSEIGKRIFDMRRDKQTEHESAKQRLGDIKLLTEEEQQSVTETIKGMETQLAEQKNLHEEAQKAKDVLLAIEEATKRATELTTQIAETNAKMQTDAYVYEEKLVTDFRRTDKERAWYKEADKRAETVQMLMEKERGYQQSYAQAMGHWHAAKAKQSEYELKAKILDSERLKMEPHAAMYVDSNAIVLLIGALQKLQKTKLETETQLKKLREELQGQERSLVELAMEKAKEERALVDFTSQLSAKQAELKALDQSGIFARKHAIVQSLAVLTALDKLYDKLQSQKQKLEECRVNEQRLKQEVTHLSDKNKVSEEAENLAKKVYDTALLASHEVVKNLRATLSKGDSCPVCGHDIDHDLAEHSIDTAVQPLKEAWQKAKRENSEALSALKEAQASLKSNTESIDEYQDTIKGLEEELDESKSALDTGSPEDKAAVAQMRRSLGDEQLLLDKQVSVINKLQADIEILQKSETTQRNLVSQVVQKVSQIEKEIEAKRQEIKAEEKSIAVSIRDARETEEQLLSVLTYPDKAEMLKDNLPALTSRIKDEAKEYNRIATELTGLREQSGILLSNLKEAEKLQEQIEVLLPEWTEVAPVLSEYDDCFMQEWQKLERILTDWQKELSREQTELSAVQDSLTTYFSEAEGVTREWLGVLAEQKAQDIATTEREHAKLTMEYSEKTGQLKEIIRRKGEAESKREELKIADSIEVLTQKVADGAKRIEELNAKKSESELTLRVDAEQRKKHAEVQELVRSAEEEYEKWHGLSAYFGDSTGNKFRAIAQSYILAHLLHLANDYLRRFSDRYVLTCSPGSLAILVTDTERGFTPQSINVLSGGESFMVSLALALALSGMNTANQNLDLLFIDEGFGTLDSECLNTVMNTLETLHLIGGRRVGIISHVQELRERIPAQIRVKRIDPTRSAVSVVKADNALV